MKNIEHQICQDAIDILKNKATAAQKELNKSKLSELKKAFADLEAIVVDTDCDYDNTDFLVPLQNSLESIQCQLNCLYDSFYNYIYQHAQGHLPPINGAGKMADVLKKLGLDDDYEVQPQTIWASDGSVKEIVIKLVPKKK